MLNYPPLHFTRPELSALAAKAQAGDGDAFVLLIRGSFWLYHGIAYQVSKRPDYRDDLIQDAILHTYNSVLPKYDPSRCWVALLKVSITRRMRLFCKAVSGPLSANQTRLAPTYAAALPANARGIVEPTRCRSVNVPHVPTILDEMVEHSELTRLQAELKRLRPVERECVLEKGQTVGDRRGFTRKYANQVKHNTIAKLKDRLVDILP